MWSEKTTQGVLGKYVFYRDKLVDVEYKPIQIYDFGQARFMENDAELKILEEMHKNSLELVN